MKRILTIFFALSLIIELGVAKNLIVYYSYTGNCETIATELAKQISADVLSIQPAEKGLRYEANGYALGTQLLDAIKNNPSDTTSYPTIDPVNVSVTDYSTIIVITPLWWGQMAAIMQSYLFRVGSQLAGKKVGLIVSSASSGISGVVSDCKRLVPDANYIKENLWINNSNRSKMSTILTNWVETCGLNPQEEMTVAKQIYIIVGDKTFVATLVNNETGRAFAELLPLTLKMNELNGNEKYYYLDSSLSTSPYKPGTIQTGDLMLYGDDCVVLFYKTFNSSYQYTRIGSIENPDGLAESLGIDEVVVRFDTTASTIEIVDSSTTSTSTQTIMKKKKMKFFRNGIVHIRLDDRTYSLMGTELKKSSK